MSVASAKHASTATATETPQRPWYLWLITAAALAVIVCGAAMLWMRGSDAVDATGVASTDLAWYSSDDGKTWFADKKNPLNFVTRDGRPAYRCWVYTCDGGKTTFAAYLQRYAPDAQKKLQAYADGTQSPDPRVLEQIATMGVEVKRPGGSNWISASHEQAWEIQQPTCPGGGSDRPQLVPPKL